MSTQNEKKFMELLGQYNECMEKLLEIKAQLPKYCSHSAIVHYANYEEDSVFGNEVYSCSKCGLQGNMIVEPGQNEEDKITTKSMDFDMLKNLYKKNK